MNVSRAPPDEFVENVHVFLQLVYLGRILCVDDGERRWWCTILDEVASRLQKASGEVDLIEGVRIFEELESGTGLH